MQKISNKSKDLLHKTLSEAVMKARVKIAKIDLKDKVVAEMVYDIMYDLSVELPENAINCFK